MLDQGEVCRGVEEWFTNYVGSLYDIKDYPIHVLRGLLKKVWKIEKLREVKIQTNIVQIFFRKLEIIDKILKRDPGVLITICWRYKGGKKSRSLRMNPLIMSIF